MTSASELFFNRRSRLDSRNPNHNLLDVGPTHLHRRPPSHRLRRHVDDCGTSRHRILFGEEHELLDSDVSSPNNSRISNNNGGTVRGRTSQFSLIQEERLPGTVLQARARLLERLHGIHIHDNRQNVNGLISNNVSSISTGRENWEIEAHREQIEFDVTESASQKPPGLSKETICNLPQEILQENEGVTRASFECCICLDRFQLGEKLFRLPCHHRFHPPCLEPWLLNCGDCPYCRASL